MFRHLGTSQTLLINAQTAHLAASGRDVIRFGFGQSPFSPPSFVHVALAEAANFHGYSAVEGLMALREAVALSHGQSDGVDYQPEHVLIGAGSKSLIYAAIGMFDEVDVLIPAPSWVSYAPQAALWGARAIPVATSFASRWMITPETLEAALAQKASADMPSLLILNYPSNPTGQTLDAASLKAIADVCRQYGVFVLSDEIYGRTTYDTNHVSMASMYSERTLVTGGLSKWCGAGGWRIGVALSHAEFPAAARAAMIGIASETYSCAGIAEQHAAIAAYSPHPDMRVYLEKTRQLLHAAGHLVWEVLEAGGVAVHAAKGGFYLFPDFSLFTDTLAARGIHTGSALCEALLKETGVALLPASAFGMPDSMLAARLAFVDFNGNEALHAWDDHADAGSFLAAYAPKLREGAARIVSWLHT